MKPPLGDRVLDACRRFDLSVFDMMNVVRFYIFLGLIVLSVILVGCAGKSTRVSEVDAGVISRAYLFEKKSRPIQITPETVVLDARSFFDFQVHSVAGAIHVDPQEFILRRWHLASEFSEEVQAERMARRLALLGISPMIHVVVIGSGHSGNGEEGEVALALMALGVERVQLSSIEELKKFRRRGEAPIHANQRIWNPRNVSGVFCSLAAQKTEGAILNVGKTNPSAARTQPQLTVLKRDWKEFVSKKDLSPNAQVRLDLEKNHLQENSEILVAGPQGALVTFSLLQLGFSRSCLLAE